jgi:hypothetical protein
VSNTFDIHYEGLNIDQVAGIRATTFGDYPRVLGVRGIQKMVNRYLKAILTPKGTDLSDRDYGTHLAAALGNNVDRSTLGALAAQSVRDAENKVREYDSEYGTDDDERLSKVELEGTVVDPEGNGVFLSILLENVSGVKVRLLIPQLFEGN